MEAVPSEKVVKGKNQFSIHNKMFKQIQNEPSGDSGRLVGMGAEAYWTSRGTLAPRAAERLLSTYQLP